MYDSVVKVSVTANNSFGSIGPSLMASPRLMASPSAKRIRAANGNVYVRVSVSPSIVTAFVRSAGFSSIETTVPVTSEISARPLGIRASTISCTRGKPCVISFPPATPPVWKLRIVNWVPGSPIDWAATVPTASPTSTSSPVAKLRP